MKKLVILLIIAILVVIIAPWKSLSKAAKEDFESYHINKGPLSSDLSLLFTGGRWNSNWKVARQVDGASFITNEEKGNVLSGKQSMGLWGRGGSQGTGFRRSFATLSDKFKVSYLFKATYDVTDKGGNKNKSVNFILRNRNDEDAWVGQILSFYFAEGQDGFSWFDGEHHTTGEVTFVKDAVYSVILEVDPKEKKYALVINRKASNAIQAQLFKHQGKYTLLEEDRKDFGSIVFFMRGPAHSGKNVFIDDIEITKEE